MAHVQAGLTEEQKVEMRSLRDGFEAKMKADPSDIDALEGAAVTYANLGDYQRAEELLVKLSASRTDDVDVWRLLGETRGKLKQTGKAVAAFGEALKLAGNDVQVLKVRGTISFCATSNAACLLARGRCMPSGPAIL